jgi:hypothetical protein
MAFNSLSTLEKSDGQTWRGGRARSGDALISTVDGNVDDWVLVNIPESQVGGDDELLGLESWCDRFESGNGLRGLKTTDRLG